MFILRPVVACFFFFYIVHQRTKRTVVSDCMNCLCILPLPLLHSSPSSPLSLRQRLMRQGISGPLLPCMSGSIEGKPDCQWTQTATELLAQPQWSLRTPTTSHLQRWLSVFLQNKLQSNSQTEISCSERVCMDVCVCECVWFFNMTELVFGFHQWPNWSALWPQPSCSAPSHHR